MVPSRSKDEPVVYVGFGFLPGFLQLSGDVSLLFQQAAVSGITTQHAVENPLLVGVLAFKVPLRGEQLGRPMQDAVAKQLRGELGKRDAGKIIDARNVPTRP